METKSQGGTNDAQGEQVPRVKVVAEAPGDEDMREQQEQQKEQDGYPGSCGI